MYVRSASNSIKAEIVHSAKALQKSGKYIGLYQWRGINPIFICEEIDVHTQRKGIKWKEMCSMHVT